MSTDKAPQHVYEAVARAQFYRWGYHETLGVEGEADFIADQVNDPNLRADADVVWSNAMGEAS